MANAENEDIVLDVEEIEDGEIKDSQEVYVVLSETDGEDEPEAVDSYGRVKRPRPNDKDSASSLSAITKNVTLGSLLAIDRSNSSRPALSTRKVSRGNTIDGRQWEFGDRERTRPYNKVWGSQIFNNRDRNKPTTGVHSRRKRNDIWGNSIEGSRQEAIQRKRKAERNKPKRRSKSKEYDTLLREHREVQRAIRAEEARQNADSNRRASSVRRSLPRRHSRLSSVAKTTPKHRPKSRITVTSVESSKHDKSKPKQDEDDEMTELELRRLALVSASKKVSIKSANDLPSNSLNGDKVTKKQSSEEKKTATSANSQSIGQDNYEEVAMEVEDDIAGVQNIEKGPSPVTERTNSTLQKNSSLTKEDEDDDEIEELALRAELLKTMASKKNASITNQEGISSEGVTTKVNSPKSQESVTPESPKAQSRRSSPYQEKPYTYQPTRIARQRVIPPTHGPLVITVNGDSDSSDEECTTDDQVKRFLRQFRNPPKQSKDTPAEEEHTKDKDKVVLKTPEALNKLPETHIAEYRRLKEEIAQREQRKETKKGNTSMQNEIRLKRIAALEAKLNRNRSLMEKNYQMYQESARHQSEKQRNLQKALFRIQKLREQITVMEKVAVLNRNLVKKYSDEQKSRLITLEGCVPVENEVREELMALRDSKVEEFELVATIKQLRDEQTEMTKTRMQTGLQEKSTKMTKAVRKQANELHRLKKLEEEYALKIKQYREAQAKAASQPTATNQQNGKKKVEANIRPAVSIYKKDKIQFSSSNTPTQTDSETEKENIDKDNGGDNGRRKRRRSWLDDNSSLTPQLSAKQKKVTHLTKFKDRLNSSRKDRNLVEPPQLVERNSVDPPQSVADERGFEDNNCDRGIQWSLRCDYLHPSNYFMKEFLSGRRRKRSILKVHSEAVHEETQVIKVGKYISPLMCFKAYRLHEAYWKAAGLSPFSKTVSNKVNPRRVLCKFELNGVCNDSSCRCLHERDYLLSDEAILADILSYAPSLVNVTPKMTPEEQSQKIQRFLQSVKEQVSKENTSHPTKDEGNFCLKSVVRQLKKEKVECPVLCERQWIPKNKDSINQTNNKPEDAEEEDNYFQIFRASKDPEGVKILGVDDSRYYSSEDKDVEALESLVLEEPNQIHHWLKLVNLILQNSSSQSQDRALNALSRGLEHNPSSPDLWLLYLSLYSLRPEHPDLAEICSQAMDHCKEYSVHWKCLEVAETFHTKLSTCQDILQFLTSDLSKRKDERTSHEVFETLLYQTQLHVLMGQLREACQLLKDVLSPASNDDDDESAFLSFLTRPDACLLWVIYIHLESFHSLPLCLFEDNGCGLGHVIKKSHFICPWHQHLVCSLEEVIALFDAASKSMKEDSFNNCSVLYHNWIALLSSSNRKQDAVDLCRHILEKHPEERSVWKTLLVLEMKRSEDIIKVREVYYEAFSKCPPSPQLYYTAAKIENSEGFPAEAVTILSDSAAVFFDLPPEGVSHEYTCNLFRILLHLPVPISFKSPPMQTKFQPIIDNSQESIWLCFCFLLTLKPFSSEEEGLDPNNAFELAISSLPSGEGLLDVCLQYFQYQLWRSGPTAEEKGKTLRQVIKRIITTRPSSFPFPFTEDCVYIDYSLHNSILDVYLEHLQPEYLTEAYEDYVSLMPQNLALLQKFIDYLWHDEAYHYIKFLAKSALNIHPKSLFLWNVLLQATEKTGDVKEVAYLSSEAARALPIVAHLWRHRNQKVDLPGTSEKTVDKVAST